MQLLCHCPQTEAILNGPLDKGVDLFIGLTGALFVLVVQYFSSTARRNTRKVAEATKVTRLNWQEATLSGVELSAVTGNEAMIRNTYRFYLSVFIERMVKTFGTLEAKPATVEGKTLYPCLIWIEKDQKGNVVDRWKSHQLYVRHLIESVSEYLFLRRFGIQVFSVGYRRTLLLAAMLEQIETIVGRHDALMDSKHKAHIDHYPGSHGYTPEYFWVDDAGLDDPAIMAFLAEMEVLRANWLDWEQHTH